MMSRFFTRTNILLAAIVLVAAFFRLYRLDQIPPGFQFDQAFYVFDAIQLLRGDFAIFFREPGRSEPLYQYLLMVGVAFLGDTSLSVKFTGAVIGTLTIPLIYSVTRTIFTPSPAERGRVGVGVDSSVERGRIGVRDDSPASQGSERIALLAVLFAAFSIWHIFYSRYGERIPLTVLMALLTFGFLWRALHVSRVTRHG